MYRLMVVDDSNIIRRKIERSQKDSQFDIVVSVVNGREAVEALSKFTPDIITMDLTMPEMDGIQTISHIRQINKQVKILVVSALKDKATAIKALKKGAQGFVCKPFSDYELQDALLELVEG